MPKTTPTLTRYFACFTFSLELCLAREPDSLAFIPAWILDRSRSLWARAFRARSHRTQPKTKRTVFQVDHVAVYEDAKPETRYQVDRDGHAIVRSLFPFHIQGAFANLERTKTMSEEEKTAEQLAQAEVFEPPALPAEKTKIDNPRPGRWHLWCLDCDQKFTREARQRAHCAAEGHRPGVAASDAPKGAPSPKAPTPQAAPQPVEKKQAAKPETFLQKLGFFRR